MNQADINRRIAYLRSFMLKMVERGEIELELVEPYCQRSRSELEALAVKRCPRCGAELRVEVDPRMAGHSRFEGPWMQYECRRCGFRCDVSEAL